MTVDRAFAAFVAGAVLTATSGCTKILGVDEYRVGERRDASGAAHPSSDASSEGPVRDSGTLFDPKPPYLSGTTQCKDCVAAKCSAESTTCDQDPDCSAWLADVRAHPGPVESYERALRNGAALWAKAESDGGSFASVAIPQTALRKCAIERCTWDCELGRDFSCAGNFEWPGAYPPETVRSIALSDATTGAPLSGALVRACQAGVVTCTPEIELGSATAGANGTVVLTIKQPSISRYAEFDGILVVEQAEILPTVVQSSRPLVSGEHSILLLISRALLEPMFGSLGLSFDTPGVVFGHVQPFDCRGQPVKGVTLEVLVLKNGEYVPCTLPAEGGQRPCGVMYSNDQGFPTAAVHEFSTLGQNAYFEAPAVNESLFVLRDVKSRIAVAAYPFSLLEAHWHGATLYPASTSQLAKLPTGERVR